MIQYIRVKSFKCLKPSFLWVNNKYKRRAQNFLIAFAQVYTLNLLDVTDGHRNNTLKTWDGGMFADKPIKNPWGAVARSAMIPGWGQVYNEQYLKAVISFGLVFDFARKVYVFNKRYESSGDFSQKERRIVNSWYLGLFYLLNMVDAYVDAYLFRFDDTMQLTWNFQRDNNTLMLGVSIVY